MESLLSPGFFLPFWRLLHTHHVTDVIDVTGVGKFRQCPLPIASSVTPLMPPVTALSTGNCTRPRFCLVTDLMSPRSITLRSQLQLQLQNFMREFSLLVEVEEPRSL